MGAACDFLTPIGHQCNTMVMGPGGYKFSDYPKLGAPLSLLVLIIGPPMILLFGAAAAALVARSRLARKAKADGEA